MGRMHQLLALVLFGSLAIAAGEVATFLAPATPARPGSCASADSPDATPVTAEETAPASCDEALSTDGPDAVPPGCCATQCTRDNDCRKLCGPEGICLRVNSCCVRCVC